MEKIYYTYLKKFSLIFFTLLAFILIVNYTKDPLDKFNKSSSRQLLKNFYEKVNSSNNGVYFDEKNLSLREIKKYFANYSRGECAIIGTSSSQSISSSAKIKSFKSNCNSIINLSIPMATYEDFFAFSYFLKNRDDHKPKKIIFNISPWSFSPYSYDWNYFEKEVKEMQKIINKKNDSNKIEREIKKYNIFIDNILNLNYFILSIKSFFKIEEIKFQEVPNFNQLKGLEKVVILNDGSLINSDIEISRNDFLVYEDSRIKENKYFNKNAFTQFKDLLKDLKNEFEVQLLLVPFHHNTFKNKESLTFKAIRFTENEIRDLSDELNIKIFGSYNPEDVGCKSFEFIDYIHPNHLCLSKIN